MTPHGKDRVKGEIAKVGDELSRWNALRAQLEELEADPQCLFDTLDGETELTDALLLLSEEVAERQTMAAAVKARIQDLQDRKTRIDGSIETLRQVILISMDRAEIKSIKGNLSTLTVTKANPKAEVIDQAMIPSRFWRPQDPKLDVKELTAALQEGDVEGARLSNGGIGLTIRRK